LIATYFEGLLLGASLIIAIGAQNAFVIRQGIKGQYVFTVAAVCAVVDILLITVGAAGVGTLIAQSQMLRMIAAWGGAIFLLAFGAMATRAAIKASSGAWDEAESQARNTFISSSGTKGAIIAAAGFSLLNPHVYLDTVVILGGLAAQYDGMERAVFAAGAMTASPVWFFCIGYGAIKVAPFFRTSLGARLMESTVAVIMFILAFSLVHGELQGLGVL
jgi:L-lysine exporter family protein LysE/ArgO